MEFLQKVLFTLPFPGDIFEIVSGDQMRIMRRVPILIVHSIKNPVKVLPSLSQNAFQSITEFRGLDLFAIFLTYGIDDIGIHNACLHEVDPLPKFDSLWIVHLRRKAGEPELLLLEQSLIGNVMDREYCSRMGKKRIDVVNRFEIGGDQSGLPFMMVEDVRGKSDMLAKVESSLGEEDEALGIVEVIAFRCAVEVFPVKELLPADEINRDVLVQMAQIDIRLELLIPHGNLNLPTQILMGKSGLFHHSIIRHD